MDVDSFLADVAAWAAGNGIRASVTPLQRREPQTFDESYAEVRRIAAEHEEHYRQQVAKWNRDAPMRERAERAHRAAIERRRRELGLAADEPIPPRLAAAMPWDRPQQPRIY